MAASLQEWARRYIRITQQPRTSPAKQARIRAVIANGPEKGFLLWGGDGLAIYLHLSVSLFITGAAIFLFNVNHIVFGAAVWWAGLSALGYAFFTLVPIFKPEFLLHTPLSRLAMPFFLAISYAMIQVCSCIPPFRGLCHNIRKRSHNLHDRWRAGLLLDTYKAAEEIALKPSSKIDSLIMERILLTPGEDQALEQFFDAVPGFFRSQLVNGHLSYPLRTKFQRALDGFLDRTFSSNSISETIRSHRLIVCLSAARAALGSDEALKILHGILDGRWKEALESIEIGHSLRRWDDGRLFSSVRRIVSRIVSRVPERSERWIALVKDEYGIPDFILRDCIPYGDSVSLAILNRATRQLFRPKFSNCDSDIDILQEVSNFSIDNTLPRLQHDFCALWNEVVQEAWKPDAGNTPKLILKSIRHVFVALHQDNDAALATYSDLVAADDNLLEPLSYPLCSVGDHLPDSTPHVEKAPVGDHAQSFSTVFLSHNVLPLHTLDPGYTHTLPAAEPSLGGARGLSPSFTTIYTPSTPAPLNRRTLRSTPPDLAVPDTSRRSSDSSSHRTTMHPVDTYPIPARSSCTIPAVFTSSTENPMESEPATPCTPRTESSPRPPPACPSFKGLPRF
jgi:hypothetical protein